MSKAALEINTTNLFVFERITFIINTIIIAINEVSYHLDTIISSNFFLKKFVK